MKPNWFIGLPLDDAWVEPTLAGIPDGLRTFHGEDIHMTVAFLGPAGADAANRAWDALVQDAPGRRDLGGPFDVALGRVLPFGDPKCPSSLSVVPAEDDDPSKRFIAAHRNRLREAAGLRAEQRAVRPHASIARIKRRAKAELRSAALAWAGSVPPVGVTVPVREVALYTWTEDRRTQLFRIVRRVSLG